MKKLLLSFLMAFFLLSMTSCVASTYASAPQSDMYVQDDDNVVIVDNTCYIYYTSPTDAFLSTLFIIDGAYHYWYDNRYIPCVFPCWSVWSPHRFFYFDNHRWFWRNRTATYDHHSWRSHQHWGDYRHHPGAVRPHRQDMRRPDYNHNRNNNWNNNRNNNWNHNRNNNWNHNQNSFQQRPSSTRITPNGPSRGSFQVRPNNSTPRMSGGPGGHSGGHGGGRH